MRRSRSRSTPMSGWAALILCLHAAGPLALALHIGAAEPLSSYACMRLGRSDPRRAVPSELGITLKRPEPETKTERTNKTCDEPEGKAEARNKMQLETSPRRCTTNERGMAESGSYVAT